jgi:peptidoglycan/xylan/chitin deacetylase (PgdA/CDA1 family)
MSRPLKRLALATLSYVPLRSNRWPILYAHDISPVRHPMSLAPETFVELMQALADRGLRGVPLREAITLNSSGRPAPVFALCFDDGFDSILQHAAAPLGCLGFRATVFACSRLLGQPASWPGLESYQQATAERGYRPHLLDVTSLRALIDQGWEIGSHTLDHADLCRLSPAEVRHQLVASRHELTALLRTPVETLCYPYGAVRSPIPRLAALAGYRAACTIVPGHASSNQDEAFLLPRLHLDNQMDGSLISAFVSPAYGALLRLRDALGLGGSRRVA